MYVQTVFAESKDEIKISTKFEYRENGTDTKYVDFKRELSFECTNHLGSDLSTISIGGQDNEIFTDMRRLSHTLFTKLQRNRSMKERKANKILFTTIRRNMSTNMQRVHKTVLRDKNVDVMKSLKHMDDRYRPLEEHRVGRAKKKFEQVTFIQFNNNVEKWSRKIMRLHRVIISRESILKRWHVKSISNLYLSRIML